MRQRSPSSLPACLPRLTLTVFPPASEAWHVLVLLQPARQAKDPLILPALAQRPPALKSSCHIILSPLPRCAGLSVGGGSMFIRWHLVPWCHAPRLGRFSQNSSPGLLPPSLIPSLQGSDWRTGPLSLEKGLVLGALPALSPSDLALCRSWVCLSLGGLPGHALPFAGGCSRRVLQWWVERVWEIIGGRVSKPHPPSHLLLIIKPIFSSPS